MAKEFIKNADISDVLIERPISFSIKNKRFMLYHPTLGKLQLMTRLFDVIGLGRLKPNDDIYYFSFSVANTKRDECLRLIAYSTLPENECLDEGRVRKRIESFGSLDTEDIATILITVFTIDKTEEIMHYFGMDEEAKRLEKVSKIKSKSSKGSLSFGGKSIWGSLIDAACERYGWSYQYVLWGISYSNLRLLLADQIRTLFLTDEERKKAHIPADGRIIKGDDAKAMEQFIKTQNWK